MFGSQLDVFEGPAKFFHSCHSCFLLWLPCHMSHFGVSCGWRGPWKLKTFCCPNFLNHPSDMMVTIRFDMLRIFSWKLRTRAGSTPHAVRVMVQHGGVRRGHIKFVWSCLILQGCSRFPWPFTHEYRIKLIACRWLTYRQGFGMCNVLNKKIERSACGTVFHYELGARPDTHARTHALPSQVKY